MKQENRLTLGVILGFIITLIGCAMIGDMKSQHLVGILLVSGGLVICGLSSFHSGRNIKNKRPGGKK